MADDAELEIGLYRDGGAEYTVELRFQLHDGSAERAPVRGRAPIDLVKLRGLELDRKKYGEELTKELFADAAVRQEYKEIHAVTFGAVGNAGGLRLRLFVDGRGAPELNGVRWENLVSPVDGSFVVDNERSLFSRFLRSSVW
jgi:hypothetical protein